MLSALASDLLTGDTPAISIQYSPLGLGKNEGMVIPSKSKRGDSADYYPGRNSIRCSYAMFTVLLLLSTLFVCTSSFQHRLLFSPLLNHNMPRIEAKVSSNIEWGGAHAGGL